MPASAICAAGSTFVPSITSVDVGLLTVMTMIQIDPGEGAAEILP
jgi:hypothetical protein